jgi:hypothetical protein
MRLLTLPESKVGQDLGDHGGAFLPEPGQGLEA